MTFKSTDYKRPQITHCVVFVFPLNKFINIKSYRASCLWPKKYIEIFPVAHALVLRIRLASILYLPYAEFLTGSI